MNSISFFRIVCQQANISTLNNENNSTQGIKKNIFPTGDYSLKVNCTTCMSKPVTNSSTKETPINKPFTPEAYYCNMFSFQKGKKLKERGESGRTNEDLLM